MSKVGLFVDHTDASEYLGAVVLKTRKVTRMVCQDTPGKYAQRIEKAYFTDGIDEFVLPYTWETILNPKSQKLIKELPGLVSHLPVKITAPLESTTLETIISKLKTRKNFAGSCEHWQKEAPTESCGMCLPCLHKYLILKKLKRPTEDIFLEDPITGYDGKIRFYNFLKMLSSSTGIPNRLHISVSGLICDCFMQDFFPLELSNTMEKRFKPFLTAWGGEL